jgi:hypothetical protein
MTEHLHKHIEEQHKQGYSLDAIKQHLIQLGISQKEASEALSHVHAKKSSFEEGMHTVSLLTFMLGLLTINAVATLLLLTIPLFLFAGSPVQYIWLAVMGAGLGMISYGIVNTTTHNDHEQSFLGTACVSGAVFITSLVITSLDALAKLPLAWHAPPTPPFILAGVLVFICFTATYLFNAQKHHNKKLQWYWLSFALLPLLLFLAYVITTIFTRGVLS